MAESEEDFTDVEFDVTTVTVDVGWADALEEQFGTTPWWLFSVGVHAVVLLLLSLIVLPQAAVIKADDRVTIIPRREIREDIPELPIVPPRFDDRIPEVDQPTTEIEFDSDVIVPDPSPMEYDDPEPSKGRMDSASETELMTPAIMGVGAITGAPPGNPYALRFKNPGGPGPGRRPPGIVAPILNRALVWLARNQEPDGHWDAAKHGGKRTDVGVTGLALLAFLGDGHTERVGKYKSTVRRAVLWLQSQQEADGCIGRGYDGGIGYHHSIAGLALAEAYGMGRVPETGRSAQLAVNYSTSKHQADYSGWRYKAGQEADTSVTGWFVMQLKSAMVSGLKVDGRGFQGALSFLDQCTKKDGNYDGLVAYQPGRSPTTAMTSVGLVCRQFMGYKRHDPVVMGAAEHLRNEAPQWTDGKIDFYYWYYGAIGMFQMGKGHFREWGSAMVKTLEQSQRDGDPIVNGSWDPVGRWANRGGRVFTTALGALCLEVWYRYPSLYQYNVASL